MKGVILAGGTGSRLYPLTKVTNKHLLPIYDKPMIYYPISTLRKAGVTNILIVTGRNHMGHFLELLGSGADLGVSLAYEVQEEAGGIAQALSLAEDFADRQRLVALLGDNIIEDDITPALRIYEQQKSGAKIFLKPVDNPGSYGIAQCEGGKIVRIVEKPTVPTGTLAVVGAYLYDTDVFDIIRTLQPSPRGELEITDVNNAYVARGDMTYEMLSGWWGDAGESFESYLKASLLVAGRYHSK